MADLTEIERLVKQSQPKQALEMVRAYLKSSFDWDYALKEVEILREMGATDEALKISRSLERRDLDYLQRFDLDLEKLYCFWTKFEIEIANEYMQTLQESVIDVQDHEHGFSRIARFYHLKSNIFAETGRYREALSAVDIAIEYYLKLDNAERQALMLNNKGFILSLIGDPKIAEMTLKESLSLYQIEGKLQDLARVYNNLGIVKTQQEQFEDAETYLLKGLQLQLEVNNPLEISYSLLELIQLRLLTNKDPSQFMEQLRDLSTRSTESIVRLRYQLANGMVLKSVPRYRSKVEAQQLLENIAWDTQTPQRYALSALKHLAEIKFEELQNYGDEAIMDDIQNLIDRQFQIANMQNSIIAEVEARLLESKLFLIRGEVDTSIKSLEICLTLSKDHDLDYFAKLSNDFLRQLGTQLQYWKNQGAEIDRRIEKAEIFSFLRNIQYENLGNLTMEQEIPILFMIIDTAGSVKLNIRFVMMDEINEQMIGTFISAINLFFSEAFVSSNNIERINSNDYTLLLKAEYGITYCYIFKGQSYFATRKLREVITELKMMTSYQNFVIDRGLTIPISMKLDQFEEERLKQIMENN
ncbi:MAG: tetratricopeptide repeat protein [Candidatus Kariarchaeaceae archaeon]|jgi:tetratricopeptide (TPR) repeat protein